MLNIPFTVVVAPTDEDAIQANYQGPIEGLAQWTAAHKALMTLTLPDTTNRLIITADTTVLFNGQVLNKPRDKAHARELLLSLRGHWHQVVTGIVVSTMIDSKLHLRSKSCTTPVLMRNYSEEEVDAYIATGDPLDKAGAYGIQHLHFQPTERINGCYLNVVGLPLRALVDLLAEFNVYPATSGIKNTVCPWSEKCLI